MWRWWGMVVVILKRGKKEKGITIRGTMTMLIPRRRI
jgi:hypothetical protein